MKKFAKLSLVAAVAVAGLSSTASAAALEEAIKNTSISGQFRYRTHQVNEDTPTTDVEVEVGVKSKITDTVTAVFKIDTAKDTTSTGAGTGSAQDLRVEDYYFSYSNNGTTVNLGQQNIPTRQLYGKQGNGIVALQKVNGFTVGAAYFMDSNAVSGGNDVSSVLATGNIGGVAVLAQVAEVQNTGTALNVKADTAVSGIKLGAEYAEWDTDGSTAKYETTKISASGKVGSVALAATYVSTGKDGSGSIDASNNVEAAAESTGFQLHSNGRADADYVIVKATLPVAPKTSLTAYYADGEQGSSTDISEYFGQVTYAASKNLNAYVRYGTKEQTGSADSDKFRLEVKYSF